MSKTLNLTTAESKMLDMGLEYLENKMREYEAFAAFSRNAVLEMQCSTAIETIMDLRKRVN